MLGACDFGRGRAVGWLANRAARLRFRCHGPRTGCERGLVVPRTPTAAFAFSSAGGKHLDEAVQVAAVMDTQAEAPKIVVVVNTQRNRAHMVKLPSKVSLCNWFTCGSPEIPAVNAKFTSAGDAKKCSKCFGCS